VGNWRLGNGVTLSPLALSLLPRLGAQPRLKNWGVQCLSSLPLRLALPSPLLPSLIHPPSPILFSLPPSLFLFFPSPLPFSPSSLSSLSSFSFSGPHPLKPARGSGDLWAPTTGLGGAAGRFQCILRLTNGPLVSCDSGVEVYRWRTSITGHKVDQNFAGVGHPQPEFFWGCPDTHDTHIISCATACSYLESCGLTAQCMQR